MPTTEQWWLYSQPTRIGRLRVVCGWRFHADHDREQAEMLYPDLELETFRDDKGHWCYGPKEE